MVKKQELNDFFKSLALYGLAHVLVFIIFLSLLCGVFGIVIFVADGVDNYSKNITVENYVVSCEVNDKYEYTDSKLDVATSLLLNMPLYQHETIYVIVFKYQGQLYEIEVDEDVYNEISIGESKKCEVVFTSNEIKQEYSYKLSLLEE